MVIIYMILVLCKFVICFRSRTVRFVKMMFGLCTTQHDDKEKNRTASVRKTTCHLPVFARIQHRIHQSVNVVLHDSILHERSPLNTLQHINTQFQTVISFGEKNDVQFQAFFRLSILLVFGNFFFCVHKKSTITLYTNA